MNHSVRSDSSLKVHETLSITRPDYHKKAGHYPYRALFDCFGRIKKKIPAEDESEALNLEGEVTEYNDQETNSETVLGDNPFHEEYSDSNSNTNACIIIYSTSNFIIP
ncbi:hypothetical protein AVEN_265182-1 [Araneus ventricosus]|uniref:Uncharacterized protein n=1 Tax=Araneus ventricosus TaxID=182803 RepID=A0A4Y2CS63_ARAVE|nr:hypothetical protein AVEN_265182-1 [Araneus ventricosus]